MASSSLPATAAETTATAPWPVRLLTQKIAVYIARMSPVWVEGQVLNLKVWKNLVFLTLRDTQENMSLKATVPLSVLQGLGTELSDGARVVIHAKPQWWTKNGDLQLMGDAMQTVGLGDLLARIEQLKATLAATGIFDADRKLPLPFLPLRIGLICATQGDAEHDVVENATRRHPGAQFEIRRVTVQGPRAVPEVISALQELDALPQVEVIVIARGGGSLEDLLPFSEAELIHAVANCQTPVVSAIGHEKDNPLLDYVADYRASTPTDAGKRVVPDVAQELATVLDGRTRINAALGNYVQRQTEFLSQLASRPVLADPFRTLNPFRQELSALRERQHFGFERFLQTKRAALTELTATMRAISPLATLARGYAVVRTATGEVVRTAAEVELNEELNIQLASGRITVTAIEKSE